MPSEVLHVPGGSVSRKTLERDYAIRREQEAEAKG